MSFSHLEAASAGEGGMMREGWATTVQWSGMSHATTAPAPTFTPRPTRISPTRTAPAPIQQSGPIYGALPATSPMVTF